LCRRRLYEGLFFYNEQDVLSYARARRWAIYVEGLTAEVEDSLAPGGSVHEYIIPGGLWWAFVERRKSEIHGTPLAPEVQAILDQSERDLEATGAAAPQSG